jgi:molecular chaperone Hsp33
MGAMHKGALNHNDTELTLRIEANGPIEGMVVTTNALGHVRGYVGNPHVFMQYTNGKLNVKAVVGEGHLHVTKDLKVKQIFTSSVPLISGEIAEDFAYYYTASEQIPSAVSLGVLVNDDHTVLAAGGIIIQMLPGHKEADIVAAETALHSLPPVSELVHQGLSVHEILELLTQDHTVLETMPLSYTCDCHREKFEKGLIALGPEELRHMIAEDGKIETTCHFCMNQETFDAAAVEALI